MAWSIAVYGAANTEVTQRRPFVMRLPISRYPTAVAYWHRSTFHSLFHEPGCLEWTGVLVQDCTEWQRKNAMQGNRGQGWSFVCAMKRMVAEIPNQPWWRWGLPLTPLLNVANALAIVANAASDSPNSKYVFRGHCGGCGCSDVCDDRGSVHMFSRHIFGRWRKRQNRRHTGILLDDRLISVVTCTWHMLLRGTFLLGGRGACANRWSRCHCIWLGVVDNAKESKKWMCLVMWFIP